MDQILFMSTHSTDKSFRPFRLLWTLFLYLRGLILFQIVFPSPVLHVIFATDVRPIFPTFSYWRLRFLFLWGYFYQPLLLHDKVKKGTVRHSGSLGRIRIRSASIFLRFYFVWYLFIFCLQSKTIDTYTPHRSVSTGDESRSPTGVRPLPRPANNRIVKHRHRKLYCPLHKAPLLFFLFRRRLPTHDFDSVDVPSRNRSRHVDPSPWAPETNHFNRKKTQTS